MSFHRQIECPEGWSMEWSPDGRCYVATHEDYDASYEGPEDGWVSNNLIATGESVEACLDEIEAVKAEHPHFSASAS